MKQSNTLMIQEIVRGSLFRGLPEGGFEESPICVEDLIVNTGRIFLASRIGGPDTVNSPMAYMAVGTATAAPALSDVNLPGEIRRKALAVNSATVNNVYTAVATVGGFADSVTSVSITEAGVFNHQSSGQGTMFQRVTFAAVILANSDFLAVTLETNVGSNTV